MEVNILNSDKKMLELEIVGLDHSVSQLLAESLTADKDVEFAAYKLDQIVGARPSVIVKLKKAIHWILLLKSSSKLRIKQQTFVNNLRTPLSDADE